jgi:deoxyribose-phosphate aldolase
MPKNKIMNLKAFIEATYLKTVTQAGISEDENLDFAKKLIVESIDEKYKLVMIRPEVVAVARELIDNAGSKVLVGTVVDFPGGDSGWEIKLKEAEIAILDGADELDFVVNYNAFLNGDLILVKKEVLECTKFVVSQNRTIKWIIEVAALSPKQIIQICALIKNVVIANFKEADFSSIFVKSSTGFFETQNNLPNGATVSAIKMMIENAFPLSIKAAGGIKNRADAMKMIALGVKRIGTSATKKIVDGFDVEYDY